MSAFHFDRRRLRRTAWATLVFWLFALTAGVVNACALTPAGPAERGGVHGDIALHDPHAGAPTAAAHASQHEQDSGKVSCLKFCDDESSAIAKLKAPVVDLDSSLLTVVEAWNPIAAIGSVGFRQSLERPGSQGPPLVIRYLRLAL